MTAAFLFKNKGWTLSLLGLFASAWSWTEPDLSKFARRAEQLFSEGLYCDAVPFYSQALSFTADVEIKTQLTNRLATCYLKEGKAQDAITLLYPQATFHDNHVLYLMSQAYRQLGKEHDALDLLNLCTKAPDASQEKTMLALEKGYHLFHLGDLSTAQHVFSSITFQENDPLPYRLAQLHLAKIHLMKHQYEEAFQTLELLSPSISPDHPLHLERIYLTGWLLLAMHQDSQAALCFEEIYPLATHSKGSWAIEVLHGLVISLLNQALDSDLREDQILPLISKAEATLNELVSRAPVEKSYLLLSDLYLIKAKTLSDPKAYVQAQQLLDKPDIFSSEAGMRQALLKKAEAAPTYAERSHLCECLAADPRHPASFRANAWFLKGINDFGEGLKCQNQQNLEQAYLQFAQAALSFDQTIQLCGSSHPGLSALAWKQRALALVHQPGDQHAKDAWKSLVNLISDSSLLSTMESPQEIHYLAGWVALHLKERDALLQARTFLRQGQSGASIVWMEKCLKLEGMVCLQLEAWEEAEAIFSRFLRLYPASSSIGEIWFWRAYGADQMQNPNLKKEYLQNAYTQDPASSYAAVAYFHFHSYRDYMHGTRKTIKHLQAMPLLFPSHPLLITAHYLIGLNQKKDHLSDEGQVLRRKDWTAAIEAFHLAESAFDNLFKKNLIPPHDLSYYVQIRARAQLERAQANFAIAKSSSGGKKHIYLEYAESVFKDLIQDFLAPQSFVNEKLVSSSCPYPKTWAEAELKLAQLYEEKGLPDKAEAILNDSLKHYRDAQITHAYGLMNVWFEKGKLAQKQNDHHGALKDFIEAEKAAGDFTGLSPNEKLDLWIQQSLCHKSLQEYDPAMKLLSRVINDDVISPLRIKAMYLRAEIYEMQERPELAIKQLEATARKGGEWAQKAQEKLEKTYGYQ